jgi:hypothetical protein
MNVYLLPGLDRRLWAVWKGITALCARCASLVSGQSHALQPDTGLPITAQLWWKST